MAVPSTPTGLRSHRRFSNAIMVKWNTVAGATGYKLYISRDGGTTYVVYDEYTTGYAVVKEVSSSTTYYFKVSAYNADGESALSSALSITTKAEDSGYDLWLLPENWMEVDLNALYTFEGSTHLLGSIPVWVELGGYFGTVSVGFAGSERGVFWGVPDSYNPDDEADYNEGTWNAYSEGLVAGSDLIFQIRDASSTWTERVRFYGDGGIKVPSTDAYYLGDKDTDGSWRIIRSGNDLVFQRRESGSWVTKSTISA